MIVLSSMVILCLYCVFVDILHLVWLMCVSVYVFLVVVLCVYVVCLKLFVCLWSVVVPCTCTTDPDTSRQSGPALL